MGNQNRRRFPRHVLGNSSLIMCDTGSGEVIDISRSGLSFSPLTFKEWPKKSFQIDLLLNVPETSILDITCTLIFPDTDTDHPPSRCGLAFHNLTDTQKQHLEIFCSHYQSIPLKP